MSDLQKLLDEQGRGVRTRIARACEITPSAVTQWRKVPAVHVLTVENVTGISRHILRPDVFREAS